MADKIEAHMALVDQYATQGVACLTTAGNARAAVEASARALAQGEPGEAQKSAKCGVCGWRRCNFCGCNTNASLRACCDAGKQADLSPTASAPAAEREQIRQELLNTPEVRDFATGVVMEALHQRERWGSEHDAGKTPADWFWLVGYLAGKALHAQIAGNAEKALHHTISTAAALANWHAAMAGTNTTMRPGIDPAANGIGTKEPAP